MENQLVFNSRKLDKSKAWLLLLFFGWYYGSVGSIAKQIFFYLTLGGCGLWTIYLFFTLNGKIKRYNRSTALEIGMDTQEMAKNGLL